MVNPFILRLEEWAPLSLDHRRGIEVLTAHTQLFDPRETVTGDGEEPRCVSVVMSGWAYRYKVLPDERRQIVALFLPGDMCDPYAFLLGTQDYAVRTLTPAWIAKVPASAIREMTASGPELTEALWWQTLIAIEIQREWTVSLGRRTALQRLAHLFCEVTARLARVGLSDGSECEFPMTQSDLADAAGLSIVQVNRSIQELRTGGLIELRNRRLAILDRPRLEEIAMFDPGYLHQRGEMHLGRSDHS